MKKKAELSRKSYLLKHLKSMSVYKLIVNTFNGFVYIEFDQTLDILQSKKLLFFIQTVDVSIRGQPHHSYLEKFKILVVV